MFTNSNTYQNGFDYSKNYFLNALTSKKSSLGGCIYCPFGVELYNRNFVRDSTLENGGNSQTTADTVEIYKNDFDNLPATNNPYLSTEVTLNANLSNTSWTSSTGSFTNYNASGSGSGKSIAITSASTDTAFLTLSLNVDSGYKLALTSYSFAHRSSSTGYTNYKLITNGIEIGNGSIHVASSGSTLQSTGVVTVLSPVAEKTGTINIILKLFGGSHGSTGSFRMDNFVLNGSVQQQSNGNSSYNYIASKNQYRYGFQGQEHDPEVLDYVWETTSWDSITDTTTNTYLNFSGSYNHVVSGGGGTRNITNQVTAQGWIRTTKNSPTLLYVLSKYKSSNNAGFQIVFQNGKVFIAGKNGDGIYKTSGYSTFVSDGKWHHIAGVVDANDTWSIYVDGILTSSASYSNLNPSMATTFRFDIGRAEACCTNNYYGDMKEVSLWNKAKGPSEIYYDYRKGHPVGNEPNLVGYFPINEGTGNSIRDLSLIASNGYRFNAVWKTQQIIDTNLIATDSILVPNRAFASYKYRGEDTRLGRFFAVDPLFKSYPWNSNYAFSENRVIDAVELEGLEKVDLASDFGIALLMMNGSAIQMLDYDKVMQTSKMKEAGFQAIPAKGDDGSQFWVIQKVYDNGMYENMYIASGSGMSTFMKNPSDNYQWARRNMYEWAIAISGGRSLGEILIDQWTDPFNVALSIAGAKLATAKPTTRLKTPSINPSNIEVPKITKKVYHKGNLKDGKVTGILSTGDDFNSVSNLDRKGNVHTFEIPQEKFQQWMDDDLVRTKKDYDYETGTYNYEYEFDASLSDELNNYKKTE